MVGGAEMKPILEYFLCAGIIISHIDKNRFI